MGDILEGWKTWFMMGSGIYLILLGIFMFLRKDNGMRKVIGVYNFLIGVFAIGAAIVARFNPSIGNIIFLVFGVVVLISFIIFAILRATEKGK